MEGGKAALLVNCQYLIECERALGITVDVTQIRRLLEEQFSITFNQKWAVYVDGELAGQHETDFVRRLQFDAFQVRRHQVSDKAAHCPDRTCKFSAGSGGSLRLTCLEHSCPFARKDKSIQPGRSLGVDVCVATRMMQLVFRANVTTFVILAGDARLDACLDLVRNDEARTVYIAHFNDVARCGALAPELQAYASPFRGDPGFVDLCQHLDRLSLKGPSGKPVPPQGWAPEAAPGGGGGGGGAAGGKVGKSWEQQARDMMGNSDLFFEDLAAQKAKTEPPKADPPAPVAPDPIVADNQDKVQLPSDPLMAAWSCMAEPPPPPDTTAAGTTRPPPLAGFDDPFAQPAAASPAVAAPPPAAAAVSELNQQMLAKLGELQCGIDAARKQADEAEARAGAEGGWGAAYDASVTAAPTDDPKERELAELRLQCHELRAERGELETEVECVLDELQQVRLEKDQFEREVSEINARLFDRLERLKEEQQCMREAMVADAASDEAAKLQARVRALEAEVDQARRRLEQAQRTSEMHLDKALNQQISKMELTLAQVQRRKDATESEAKGAYRQTRRLRMDTIYHDCFSGAGMSMVWAALQSVFHLEFNTQDATGDPCVQFCSSYAGTIRPHVESADALRARMFDASSLRDLYLIECAKLRCKANSGVLRLLPAMPQTPEPGVAACGDIRELDLASNFLGDLGLQALLPLLQKMPRLEVLKLAHNGLQNRGVHALCEELKGHPGVTYLDLSQNRISRSSGKELMALLAANPRIRQLLVAGTRIDDGLRGRIERKLQQMPGGSIMTPVPSPGMGGDRPHSAPAP